MDKYVLNKRLTVVVAGLRVRGEGRGQRVEERRACWQSGTQSEVEFVSETLSR